LKKGLRIKAILLGLRTQPAHTLEVKDGLLAAGATMLKLEQARKSKDAGRGYRPFGPSF
tara:strand:- start:1109 stop:1285 length:177 start_codon:yes stop_codon:yes gene_type:complete